MSKTEKIVNKILGTILFLSLLSVMIFGIIKITEPITVKPQAHSKVIQEDIEIECVRCGKINKMILFKSATIPDSITIECIYCHWENTRSLIQLQDTIVKHGNRIQKRVCF